jgi:hypothetical protein
MIVANMSLDMNGGAGEGGGGDGDGDNVGENLDDVFGYLRKESKNGIAINGILVWIDVQQKSTPPNVWLAQAAYAFVMNKLMPLDQHYGKLLDVEKNGLEISSVIKARVRKRRILMISTRL